MIRWDRAPPGARQVYDAVMTGSEPEVRASLRASVRAGKAKPTPRNIWDAVLGTLEHLVARDRINARQRRAEALRIIKGGRT